MRFVNVKAVDGTSSNARTHRRECAPGGDAAGRVVPPPSARGGRGTLVPRVQAALPLKPAGAP